MVPALVAVFTRPISVNVDTKAAIGFLLYKERPK